MPIADQAAQVKAMNTTPLDESSLPAFLDAFCVKIRRDPVLAPVFAAAIPDDAWPAHCRPSATSGLWCCSGQADTRASPSAPYRQGHRA
jgi:hypothetical protein